MIRNLLHILIDLSIKLTDLSIKLIDDQFLPVLLMAVL